jgi:hypothetical protein
MVCDSERGEPFLQTCSGLGCATLSDASFLDCWVHIFRRASVGHPYARTLLDRIVFWIAGCTSFDVRVGLFWFFGLLGAHLSTCGSLIRLWIAGCTSFDVRILLCHRLLSALLEEGLRPPLPRGLIRGVEITHEGRGSGRL